MTRTYLKSELLDARPGGHDGECKPYVILWKWRLGDILAVVRVQVDEREGECFETKAKFGESVDILKTRRSTGCYEAGERNVWGAHLVELEKLRLVFLKFERTPIRCLAYGRMFARSNLR